MAFSPETYALLKAQGGGSLPMPSAANVGASPTVQKKAVPGTVIVPKQTITTDEGYAKLDDLVEENWHTAENAVMFLNGTLYDMVYFKSGNDWVLKDADGNYNIEPDGGFIDVHGDGTYEVAVYTSINYTYEYGLDFAYDIVILADNSSLGSGTNYTLKSGTSTDVYNKISSGEYVRGLLIGDESGTSFPQIVTLDSFYADQFSTEGDIGIRFFNPGSNSVIALAVFSDGTVVID